MGDGSGFQLEGSAAERYEQFVRPVMEPFIAAVLDGDLIGPGVSVLDLACGTGFVSRAARPLVGDGHVVGLDINPHMLRMARSCGVDLAPPIRWVEGSAGALPFDAGRFDVVLCQQGLQFVPDLESAVREAARVMAVGGHFAGTVWSPMDRSPFMAAQYRSVSTILGVERSAPLARAFSCSAAQVSASCRAAGLRDVTVREVVADVRLPHFDAFVRGHLGSLPWGAALEAERPGGLDEAASGIEAALADRIDADGTAVVSFGSVLVTATR